MRYGDTKSGPIAKASEVLGTAAAGPLGVTGIREFTDPENPSRAAVLMEVPDMDALTAALQTEEAANVMSDDGVKGEALVMLVAAG